MKCLRAILLIHSWSLYQQDWDILLYSRKQCSVIAMETLCGCFKCTDWGVFKEAATDIHKYTETVSDYITFCNGLRIPTIPITSYPNDQPWFNTYIKHKLQAKQECTKTSHKYKKARYAAEKATNIGTASVTGFHYDEPPTSSSLLSKLTNSKKAAGLDNISPCVLATLRCLHRHIQCVSFPM